ncbi:hypothetical protein F8388_024958 [Cannabis sativa]|uniref:Uncharacterized protein n=1 Tax=Cannabis sativa TaxID=3483 RepID=A0A7J6G3N9_CANSA|nr:hypothetical protein F8388_024958 [Cannabis sativa]
MDDSVLDDIIKRLLSAKNGRTTKQSDVNYNTLGPVSRLSHGSSHRVFNVDDFGAKGDGTDDRKVQLKPLMDQLARVKDLAVPEFGTLLAWELRASAAARAANGDANGNDPSKSSQNGYGGPPMPFFGETKVEVAFSGTEGQEDKKSEVDHTSLKVLPPWMIKQGMNLTKEQRGGEVKQEAKMDGGVSTTETSEDKKSITENDDKKNLQSY